MNAVKIQLHILAILLLFSGSGLAFSNLITPTEQVSKEKLVTVVVDYEKSLSIEKKEVEVAKVAKKPVKVEKKNVKNIVAKKVKTPCCKSTVKENIVKHSVDMDVDPALALAIAKIESNFDHNKRSVHGAVGVFQILPSTARSMGYDAYTQNENIKSGITYYKKMYQKFGDMDLALAAYNAGPGNVSRYKGVPPFAETKRFINKIKVEYENQKNDPLLGKYQNKQM